MHLEKNSETSSTKARGRMNNLNEDIRQLRSDLHSNWKSGEFDQDITMRFFKLLFSFDKIHYKRLGIVEMWIKDMMEQRFLRMNWVRYRDALEMAVIELGEICRKDLWKDYPRKGEFI